MLSFDQRCRPALLAYVWGETLEWRMSHDAYVMVIGLAVVFRLSGFLKWVLKRQAGPGNAGAITSAQLQAYLQSTIATNCTARPRNKLAGVEVACGVIMGAKVWRREPVPDCAGVAPAPPPAAVGQAAAGTKAVGDSPGNPAATAARPTLNAAQAAPPGAAAAQPSSSSAAAAPSAPHGGRNAGRGFSAGAPAFTPPGGRGRGRGPGPGPRPGRGLGRGLSSLSGPGHGQGAPGGGFKPVAGARQMPSTGDASTGDAEPPVKKTKLDNTASQQRCPSAHASDLAPDQLAVTSGLLFQLGIRSGRMAGVVCLEVSLSPLLCMSAAQNMAAKLQEKQREVEELRQILRQREAALLKKKVRSKSTCVEWLDVSCALRQN
eukprot:362507-Chlamydomonas_euryale.AAC.10